MTALVVTDLTTSTLDGTGIFDELMRANKAHLEAEFAKNRIKGTEYSTVYLGALEAAMRISLEFLMQRQKIDLEAQLLAKQVSLADIAMAKANAELAKIPVEIAHITAQTALLTQQKLNAITENAVITANALHVTSQTAVSDQQAINLAATKLHIDAQTALTTQQELNAEAQALNIPKEGLVLDGQKCKLDAEYDLLLGNTLKTAQETTLLTQKVLTEKAQTSAVGIDADSIVGKQKALYGAQTAGFQRDAEQKAADLMVKTWMTRRTTDEGTIANSTNMLADSDIGRAVNKLLTGVGA